MTDTNDIVERAKKEAAFAPANGVVRDLYFEMIDLIEQLQAEDEVSYGLIKHSEQRIAELEVDLLFKDRWIEQTIKTRMIQADPDLSSVENPTYTLKVAALEDKDD